MSVIVVDHPLAQHLLAGLRDTNTEPSLFRKHARILASLVLIEATRTLPLQDQKLVTPVAPTIGKRLAAGLAVVPILRAGLSMLEPALDLFPDVAVGYIGLERSHETAIAHSYYCKLPRLPGKSCIIVDPMLATGGSSAQATHLVKAQSPQSVCLACIVAAPEGIATMQLAHPDVTIVCAAVDEGLNDKKYIVPGLGDYGDRLYGTL